mmetsp:Transcript_76371/g.184539  ORF Transcript_76371/g.184539 Transcript_76371/m.184539 type:complete len:273 (-) Transcript_76371:397-1215(-)
MRAWGWWVTRATASTARPSLSRSRTSGRRYPYTRAIRCASCPMSSATPTTSGPSLISMASRARRATKAASCCCRLPVRSFTNTAPSAALPWPSVTLPSATAPTYRGRWAWRDRAPSSPRPSSASWRSTSWGSATSLRHCSRTSCSVWRWKSSSYRRGCRIASSRPTRGACTWTSRSHCWRSAATATTCVCPWSTSPCCGLPSSLTRATAARCTTTSRRGGRRATQRWSRPCDSSAPSPTRRGRPWAARIGRGWARRCLRTSRCGGVSTARPR